ncbi:MAG: DUF4832 domain-containing protein [Clostridia bacterium]|nr:DUF4832 domain-containing protein [Clostridia bacterium]
MAETKEIAMADKTSVFSYRREEGQNPNTGFMSFQHFRGEALYSDCVVKPENKLTETEHYECYPIPGYVAQNGREEGYYPDTPMVYIRILWKEFEPERGVYRYDFIEDIIKKAKEHGQTLYFRLMAHSTRACDDVPDWLKTLIPCPERPDMMRVKDSPTDPLFLKLFSLAVRRFGERFDEDPTLYAMDISLPGAWGEGTNLHLYPAEDLAALMNTYTDVFRHTRLIGQFFRADLVREVSKTAKGPEIGIRGDGFGSPYHIYTIYPPAIASLDSWWQKAPVSFESYWWLGEWDRKGWDIDELIEVSLSWHASSFNAKSLPVPMKWKEKIDMWTAKMGYHFALDYVKYPACVSVGGNMEIKLGIDNVGVAPLYDEVPLLIRLSGEKEYILRTDTDVRRWMPGKTAERMVLALPTDITPGDYRLEIGMYGENYPMIYFASNAERDGKFYAVGEITVTA